ncbi:LysR family transcriptional regulator [Demequina aurantiaca]|uniref:LysR family transcriptional regulator n=1 Tax=Demequina aurantiaca TaxID=676200 RepID=UPI003D32929B
MLNLRMLDANQLRTLREFALRGTIAATADALGYTPSAVSQQLSALERSAGSSLTRRVGRRLVLTPAGVSLAASADEVLSALERAQSAVRGATGRASGTVRLAVFQSAALSLLPLALQNVRRAAPDLRVQVTQSEPAQALEDTWAREFDLVVAEEYPHHSAPHYAGLVRDTLVADAVRLATPLTHEGSTIGSCSHLPWVMEPRGAASRHFAEQLCRVTGFEPDVRFETVDLQAHIALVSAGEAVAFLPDLMHADAAGTLALHSLPQAPARTVFTAMRESSLADPAIQVVVSSLREAARHLRENT